MLLSGDNSNAGRVMLNLSELYARRAEQSSMVEEGEDVQPLLQEQQKLWLKATECCEQALELTDGVLGRSEYAFAHLRLGVHFLTCIAIHPPQGDSKQELPAELADRHFSKALYGFNELKNECEVAVCHFHMADVLLQEQSREDAPPISKSRLTAALRHARRSADYWERVGSLAHVREFIAAHVRYAQLLEHQSHKDAGLEAVKHLSEAETKLVKLINEAKCGTDLEETVQVDSDIFQIVNGHPMTVKALRREMGRVCQAGLRKGEGVEKLKVIYRQVLRNEPLAVNSINFS